MQRRALHDLAPGGATRAHTIDGLVLTKFDTIDDKVRRGGGECLLKPPHVLLTALWE